MPAVTAILFCVVVGISDGDTLTARCDSAADASAQTIKVRLAEVDAPEHHQAFGTRSRDHLASLCFKQSAEVRPIAAGGGLDRFGRTVAHVSCHGINASAGARRHGLGVRPLRHRPPPLRAARRSTSCASWSMGR